MLLVEAKFYLGLGLEAERVACTCFRKSRFMLASNLRVGTRFNSSRFSLASILASAFEAVLFSRSIPCTVSPLVPSVHTNRWLVSLKVRPTLDLRAR